jgi:hypothetical protein
MACALRCGSGGRIKYQTTSASAATWVFMGESVGRRADGRQMSAGAPAGPKEETARPKAPARSIADRGVARGPAPRITKASDGGISIPRTAPAASWHARASEYLRSNAEAREAPASVGGSLRRKRLTEEPNARDLQTLGRSAGRSGPRD